MTAEVVILNRNGVGIAADSVVTLTGLNTPNAVKTYHTQNKLFGLSASEAVAVMVYGNCYFGSFPWETIIKEFRNNHQPQSTIDKYGEELISYLVGLVDKSPMMFADDVVMRVARYELSSLRWRVNQARKGAAVQSLIFPEYDVQMAILTILRERLRALEAEPSLRLSEVEADRYVTDSVLTGDSWRKLLDEELFELPISDDISNEAIELVKLSLRKTTGIPSSTGVVLAGFGCDEMLPSCTHYWMDGVDMAGLRYAHLSTKHVDDQHDVWILPYAQTEVIDTYLRGMNPRIEAYLGTLVRGYIKSELRIELESMMSEISIDDPEAGDVVSSVMTDRIVDDVVNNVTSSFEDEFRQMLDTIVRYLHVDPVRSMVKFLPKDGLGEMAEALVGLTSLTRRITPVEETVGGPIDVAVVTKGDGLVWINRKHYFEPQLNPQYFVRRNKV